MLIVFGYLRVGCCWLFHATNPGAIFPGAYLQTTPTPRPRPASLSGAGTAAVAPRNTLATTLLCFNAAGEGGRTKGVRRGGAAEREHASPRLSCVVSSGGLGPSHGDGEESDTVLIAGPPEVVFWMPASWCSLYRCKLHRMSSKWHGPENQQYQRHSATWLLPRDCCLCM